VHVGRQHAAADLQPARGPTPHAPVGQVGSARAASTVTVDRARVGWQDRVRIGAQTLPLCGGRTRKETWGGQTGRPGAPGGAPQADVLPYSPRARRDRVRHAARRHPREVSACGCVQPARAPAAWGRLHAWRPQRAKSGPPPRMPGLQPGPTACLQCLAAASRLPRRAPSPAGSCRTLASPCSCCRVRSSLPTAS